MEWIPYAGIGTCTLILLFCSRLMQTLTALEKEAFESQEDDAHKRIIFTKQLLNGAIVLCFLMLAFLGYMLVKDTLYEGHFHEWTNLIVRWIHITFGIAWIGSSFYFISLENGLNRTKGLRDEIAGNYWAVHGGGFYYLEKYKVAPKEIPRELHWFKYESYFTWISGICLLFVVYYFNAKSMLVDPRVMEMEPSVAILIGIISMVLGWLIYNTMCRTTISKNSIAFALIGFLLAIEFAFFYSMVFAPRAAFMHFGAMLGTIMTLNVFFVIIPAQKAMVKAAVENMPLDPELGKHAGLRSLHNNYLTLPVLFIMISNHFPSTFGNEHAWLVLSGISLGSAGIKHYLNLKEKGIQSSLVFPISVLILLSMVFLTAPKTGKDCTEVVTIQEVYPIIQTRCIRCHSSKPTDKIYTTAPNGVMYDSPSEIVQKADKILQRAVLTKSMPLNNVTNMTDEEREILKCWIMQGAKIE